MMRRILFKIIPKIIGIVVVIAAGLYFSNKIPSFSFKGFGEIKIESTPVIIDKIEEIAELCLMNYYIEVVEDTTRSVQKSRISKTIGRLSSMIGSTDSIDFYDENLVIIAKTNIKAGIDLSSFSQDQIKIDPTDAKSIKVNLPKAKILDVITNPSNVNVFIEEGEWPYDIVKGLVVKSKEQALSVALQNNLLDESTKYSQEVLKNFFMSLGFNEVTFILEDL